MCGSVTESEAWMGLWGGGGGIRYISKFGPLGDVNWRLEYCGSF